MSSKGAKTAFTQYSLISHEERRQAGAEVIDTIQAVDYYEEHASHLNHANKYHVTDIGEVAGEDLIPFFKENWKKPIEKEK
ncbi:hypothetical protein [Tetragenococcus muriaticus]|uniref:Uncharacterized protein n=1 Tax=Tetragenococcus muriaticus 3MR10-3 TaxID=1302648 RepID=A0A091C6U1_9ENTE|nr:hypothetical protein [Tetragenococcus muriaticus]KFN91817.1 hypothetical protein TMU3MR103_0848 [Tetragenococcus muriaticus 3MR10-3]GMA46518.1 hypothetical protein GCM10025854_07680 [Tetragenococcus muriaticus]